MLHCRQKEYIILISEKHVGLKKNTNVSFLVLQPFDGVFEVGLADCVVIQEDGGAGAVFAPQSTVLQIHKHTNKRLLLELTCFGLIYSMQG